MTEAALFPRYIHRDEEAQIERHIAQVIADRNSRAVLLYGPGGIGKTSLVRELAAAGNGNDSVVWVDPVDVDDSEYWLLSNLERKVARELDPENAYFGPYLDYLSRLPSFIRSDIGHETVLSHLGRIKQTFVQTYRRFVEATGKTVVIVFDTIETIRGMYLQVTLTQWMKALPGTLFILSGRPPRGAPEDDPIKNELEDPHQHIPVQVITLSEFSESGALTYLQASSIAAGLDMETHEERATAHEKTEEKQKIVLLTRGHPLWLAFAIAYLGEKGMPEEAAGPLEDIARKIPYRGEMTAAGQHLHEEFKRRLVTPYREADFWHEAIKRLAVVRQSVSEPVWRELMADYPLPPGVPLEATWGMLLQTPWIRKRANGRSVTLHDAVAEELAQRIIPLHDQDQRWRRQLWERAVDIYAGRIDSPEAELNARLAAVDERLRALGPALYQSDGERALTVDQGAFIQEVAELDAQKRATDQLKVARLFYQLLCDPAAGCDQFLTLFAAAAARHDVLFEDLLALEIQRFLPGGTYAHALGDVIGQEIGKFQEWLDGNPASYVEIGIALAEYLVEERPQEALRLLDQVPIGSGSYIQRHNIHILQGNACMRIPGRVRDGLPYFERALAEAGSDAVPEAARPKLVAKAYKELGFYYRNEGMWREADDAYRKARDSILPTLTVISPDEDREEMASIQTNWAYVKGLVGRYREGTNLVESAITVRRRLKERHEEGISWSVCGEVYRYERRFQKAWEAFAQAEQVFLELKNWRWLGVIYQEQAICLFQAIGDGINLLAESDSRRDPADQAKQLIKRALDICRDQSVRAYPSALNRAGRVFRDDFDRSLAYLDDGIAEARRLSDGWFLLANLIEYVEAAYRAWTATGRRAYLEQIKAREPEVLHALEEYDFPDLKGRWELLQGALAIHRWKQTRERRELDLALENYADGFKLLAQGYAGSSGAAALPSEFAKFAVMLSQLPPEIQAEWQEQLRRAWSDLGEGSILVLARLEELY